MKLVNDNGTAAALRFEKPFREVLQRWRISLACLLFFIMVMMDFCMNVTDANCNTVNVTHIESMNKCLKNTKNNTRDDGVCDRRSLLETRDPKCDRHNVLGEKLIERVCNQSAGKRIQYLLDHDVHLDFCVQSKVVHIISRLFGGGICTDFTTPGSSCVDCLRKIFDYDRCTYAIYCSFLDLIKRQDCRHYNSDDEDHVHGCDEGCEACKSDFDVIRVEACVHNYLQEMVPEYDRGREERVTKCINIVTKYINIETICINLMTLCINIVIKFINIVTDHPQLPSMTACYNCGYCLVNIRRRSSDRNQAT